MAKNKKFRLQTLLYNKNFLIVFSIVMAIVIWIGVTLNESPVVERTIKDVEVEIDTSVPEQLGYDMYGAKDFKVDVTVRGKRYLVGDNVLKADDIKVVAITNYVAEVGKYNLQLKATPKKSDAGFTIVSKSIDDIEVYFDIPKRVEMTITPKIIIKDKLLFSDEYIADTEVLSTTKAVISGPATEVNKIKEAQARLEVSEPLKSTQNFTADLVLLDAYGEQSHKYLKVETGGSITITIPVYKKANMITNVDFTNAPNDYIKNSLGISATPKRINIAAPENAIQGLSNISVGAVDFSNINNIKNTFTFFTRDIDKFKMLDDVDKIEVVVDASEMEKEKKNINANNINFINYEPGFVVKLASNKISNVSVIGPESELNKLNENNINVNIDLEGIKLKEGKQSVNVPIILSSKNCWIYGTYKVQIVNQAD